MLNNRICVDEVENFHLLLQRFNLYYSLPYRVIDIGDLFEDQEIEKYTPFKSALHTKIFNQHIYILNHPLDRYFVMIIGNRDVKYQIVNQADRLAIFEQIEKILITLN